MENDKTLIMFESGSYRRVLAIGDLHSGFAQFTALLEAANFSEDEDLLVLMGDYTDRGAQPVETLEALMKLENRRNLVMLRGNHDQMFFDCMGSADAAKEIAWLWHTPLVGGEYTERCLRAREKSDPGFIARVVQFMRRRPEALMLRHEKGDFLLVHAGVDPLSAARGAPAEELLFVRHDFLHGYQGRIGADPVIVVIGHHPICFNPQAQAAGRPFDPCLVRDSIIMTDTCCYDVLNGCLSCVDVINRRFIQYHNLTRQITGPHPLKEIPIPLSDAASD